LDFLELKAHIRTTTGNSPARALRRQGKLPAILYGPGTEPFLLAVDTIDLEQALKKGQVEHVLFNIVVHNNGETFIKSAMIKELQTDPISRNLLHVDFYEIAMDRKITVKVPVVTTGKSPGVELGGILQIIRRELEVFCFPNEIPETIEVDITGLDIGDSVHVQDIIPEGNIEIPSDVNFTVITVISPKVEEELSAEEMEEGEEGLEEIAAEGEKPETVGED
jgi:large subunit ribosomal protein L25